MASIQQSYPLNKTAAASETEHLLGQQGVFRDIDLNDTSAIKPTKSAMDVKAIWVKNESGGALNRGELVGWDVGTTYGPGKAVGAAVGDDVRPVGIVSPFIPTAGVADNEHFWLITEGPTYASYDGAGNIVPGDELCTAAAGDFREYVFGTDDADSRFGVALATKTSGSSGDLVRVLCHFHP